MCLWPTINRLNSLLENAIAPDSPLLVHSSPLRPRDNPGGAPVLRFMSPSILRRSAIRALPKSRVNKATRAPEKPFVGMQAIDLLPKIRAEVYMNIAILRGPLFLHHPESESPAVVVLVNSRLTANSQAISCGVLSP